MDELESMLKGWTFLSLDARGKSGGLLLGWRSRFFHLLNAWGVDSGLCASLFSFELNLDICVVNIYGPFIDREGYWRNIFDLICHKGQKLILGGDPNFSLGFSEI